MIVHMLTTVDNPFNPFTHYDEWYTWDESHGYHSSSLLARVVVSSDDLSEADQSAAIEEAIGEIVEQNLSGVHRKVAEPQMQTAA